MLNLHTVNKYTMKLSTWRVYPVNVHPSLCSAILYLCFIIFFLVHNRYFSFLSSTNKPMYTSSPSVVYNTSSMVSVSLITGSGIKVFLKSILSFNSCIAPFLKMI